MTLGMSQRVMLNGNALLRFWESMRYQRHVPRRKHVTEKCTAYHDNSEKVDDGASQPPRLVTPPLNEILRKHRD